MQKETYTDRLEREIEDIVKDNPKIKLIIDAIIRIKMKPTLQYDYELERKHEMYYEVNEILKK